jgi:hypothetical protein
LRKVLDRQFLKRVYKTSVMIWILAAICAWAIGSLRDAAGVSLGFGISIGSLMLLERLVCAAFTPEAAGQSNRAIRKLLFAAVVKFAVIAFLLWVALRSGWASPVGLAVGIGLPEAVIFLKAIGTAISFGPELNRRA